MAGGGEWFFFTARGHPNVRATHRTTFEITREDYLTPRGDCIIAVKSEVGARDLPLWIKRGVQEGGIVVVVLCARNICDAAIGWGSQALTLEDPDRIIVRRSSHVDGRTLMVRSSKAARDIRRDLVRVLREGGPVRIGITVLPVDRLAFGQQD